MVQIKCDTCPDNKEIINLSNPCFPCGRQHCKDTKNGDLIRRMSNKELAACLKKQCSMCAYNTMTEKCFENDDRICSEGVLVWLNRAPK